MRISSFLIPTAAFAGAAGLSLVVAGFAATALENNSEIVVRRTLDEAGFSWAEVVADGLRVELSGEAPDEAKRFAAISKVGTVVDAARIIDLMEITRNSSKAAPMVSSVMTRPQRLPMRCCASRMPQTRPAAWPTPRSTACVVILAWTQASGS